MATERPLALLLLVSLSAVPQPARSGPSPPTPTPSIVEAGPPPLPAEPDRWLPLRVFPWQDDLQPIATSLTIDARGYLWAGSPNGPVRYNGRTWRSFEIPHEGPPVPVWTIVAARDGSMWFATDDRGVIRWQAGRWQHFDRSSGITDDRVRLLFETHVDGRDTIWAGTDQGLSRCAPDGCTPVELLRGIAVRAVLPTLSAEGRTVLWVGTNRGLLRLDDLAAPQPMFASILFTVRNGLTDNSVRSLAETTSRDGRHSLWVGTDHGLSRWRDGVWTRYDAACGFPDVGVTSLAPSRTAQGDVILWAATFRAGLARFEDDGRWRLFDSRAGLPADYIYSLLTIDNGAEPALWIATAGGIARLDRERWRGIDTRDGLPHETVFGIGEATFPDGLHSYWAGTLGGVVRLGPHGWERYTPDPSLEPMVVKRILNMKEPDGSPGLWMAVVGGLRHFAHGRWELFTSRGSPLTSDNMLSILNVPAGHGEALWAGTGRGLIRIENGRWTTYRESEGLPGKEVSALLWTPARDGTPVVWAGTDKGLARFSAGRWAAVAVPCQPHFSVTSLLETAEPNGTSWLWIGTKAGLSRVRIADGDVVPGTCEPLVRGNRQPTAAPVVSQISSDLQGRVYLFTEAGVQRLTPVPGRSLTAARLERFDRDDGLPGMYFTTGAFRDHLGRLWAGSTGGLAVLDPAPEPQDETRASPEPLYLERVRVAGRDRRLPPGTVLRHNENSLEFEYALLSFHREHATRYRTQLVGLEPEPSPWTREAREVYTRLPPGSYSFHVWGRNADGVVSGPIEASFRILRAPWLTPWALALYAAVLMGLGFGINLLRLRNVARRAAELEALISERTWELAEANRKLEQASLTDPLTGLNNRRFVALNIEPDLRMAERNHQSQSVKQRNRDLLLYLLDIDRFKEFNDWAGHPAGDRVLVELAHRLREVARASDAVVRWGGEEFLLISRWADREAGDVLASRILDAVGGKPFAYAAGRQATVTCSVGWAPYPWRPEAPEAATFEQVLNLADRALYLAKREGRDRAVGVHPGPVSQPAIAEEGSLENLEGNLVELTRVVRQRSREIPRPSWVAV